MPRSLRNYVAGLVIASAVVLVVTSFLFPIRPRIALDVDGTGHSQLDLIAGLLFWTSHASRDPDRCLNRTDHCGDQPWGARCGRLGSPDRNDRGTGDTGKNSLVWH